MRKPAPRVLIVAAGFALLLSNAGCITPPLLRRAVENRIWLGEFPHGAETVEVPVPDGSKLRGVFVPGDPGAPIVLHFLESGGSVAKGTHGFPSYQVLCDLRACGFASLLLDYRGNGVSTGVLSPVNLREDAELMWREALRRAGGDATRVVVRSLSIGALPAASLIDDGAAPRAIFLLAPVRAETAVGHYIDGHYSWPLPWLIKPWLRRPTDIDLLDSIGRARCQVLAITATNDAFLPAAEQQQLRAVVERSGGLFSSYPGLGHVDIGLTCHSLQKFERELLHREFPELPMTAARVAAAIDATPPDAGIAASETAARLEQIVRVWNPQPARLAAALALEIGTIPDPQWGVVIHWLQSLSSLRLAELSFESLRALVDFADPCGPLEPCEIERLRVFADAARDPRDGRPSLERLVEVAVAERLHTHAFAGKAERVPWPRDGVADGGMTVLARVEEFEPDSSLPRLQLPPRESLRQVVRLLLKSLAIPERVARGADGRHTIECFDGSRWLELSVPDPSTSMQPAAAESAVQDGGRSATTHSGS